MSNKKKNQLQRTANKRARNKKRREQRKRNHASIPRIEDRSIAPQPSIRMKKRVGDPESLEMLKRILPTIPTHKQSNPTAQLMNQMNPSGNQQEVLAKVQAVAHEERVKQGIPSDKVHIFPRVED